ncbi:MAG: sel1 repeat family protein [Solobacterium sp.]|jgi:TPR repeat protein|nr:sel1 repeat family protein [Solobacterium sp.]MCH4047974.1 sel1 repeat family protein [Solobacterium sp.]MCH4075440.1 sel1 repeat family protein [Solobacterium sp.]MCI1314568.1 sel1 repeat family protein [Solobacterium sp.]MCI1346759.1 sel1 repeat family protein [Solobacterium sp.]
MTDKQQESADIDVLLSGIGDAYRYGFGMDRKDYEQALRYYRKAASMGNSHAVYMIGQCYFEGKGCVRNVSKALDYYEKAAEQGNTKAMIALGDLYWNGIKNEVAPDRTLASEFYLNALDQVQHQSDMQNLPFAYTRVAECLEGGIGMEQNIQSAYYLYEAAVDAFHSLLPIEPHFDEAELNAAEDGLQRTARKLGQSAEGREKIQFS